VKKNCFLRGRTNAVLENLKKKAAFHSARDPLHRNGKLLLVLDPLSPGGVSSNLSVPTGKK